MTKYAYSLKTIKVREADFPYNGSKITCTRELANFAKSLHTTDIEQMVCVYLNAHNVINGIHVVPGTINQAVVYPREVIKNALLHGACAIIMIHNHPSGEVNPSESDIRLTKTITECARLFDILLHDHIIISEDKFFSMREEGMM